MVRIGRIAAALVALVTLATVAGARAVRAQALQRLTVQSFTLSADTDRPEVGVPFHLIVTLRVRERVTEIDNLELPMLAELELLGDERRLERGPSGTVYRETIAVAAHHAGLVTIGAATLQAIDARDRRAKQYSSNGLQLNVRGGSAAPISADEDAAGRLALVAFRLMLWIGGALCAVVLIVLVFRRRSAPSPVAAPPPLAQPEQPVRARSQREELQDALVVLRAERYRVTAVRVRALVWRMVGASEGETLADALQRPATPAMKELLQALERAAFTYEEDLSAAIEAACTILERYLE